MRRKLIILNLVMAAAVAGLGWRLREQWLQAEQREAAMLNKQVKPLPPPVVAPLPKPEPVSASAYAAVAEKMLFAKDRNPTVIVEVAAAPKPKPMPALPVMYGVMNLGDGPMAIMSATERSPHKGYQPGEQVGEFKLVSVGEKELVLEWDGKTYTKTFEELAARAGQQQQQAAAAPARPAAAPAAAPPANAPVVASAKPDLAKPGSDIGRGRRGCQPGDTSPAGTVADGMKKVIARGPFGDICRWEPVN